MERKAEVYPLIMEPSFRCGQSTPWGGHALKEKYGKRAPEEITGESLEISALPGHESRVANGRYRGKSLRDVFAIWGDWLTGKREKDFPLMLKILDAQQCLSVQVHPDDAYAKSHEGKLGKSEAWYILDAAPDSRLVYGIDAHGEKLEDIVREGRLEECLHWVNVKAGDVFYIPSGTIHALGPGIQCYEIQQSSDVTYRFWDWGRVGTDGKPRELHTRQAVSVSRTDQQSGGEQTEEAACEGGTVTRLVSDPHFRLDAVDLDGAWTLPNGRMQFLTTTVPCALRWGTRSHPLAAYQSVLVPARMENVRIEGRGRVLVSSSQ